MAKTEAGTRSSRRRGRPPGSPESTRQKRVVTLMTNAEFEKLTRIADENDKSVSAMVPEMILRYLKSRS